MPKTCFIDAIRYSLRDAMQAEASVVVIGEGVPDPKAIFGSTAGLQQQFGASRVWDMPLSENGMTGVCIGAALNGLKPVLIHQRIDFSLLAMDQMVNHAAKWHLMFHGQQSVPLVIRTIIGKGWGQGPQHSQALWGMWAQVPGIKIVLPATAKEAYFMMRSAIADPNPVLFVEHRWLHSTESEGTPEAWQQEWSLLNNASSPLAYFEKVRNVRQGHSITFAGWGYSLVELLNAAQALAQVGIEAEVFDLRVGHQLEVAPLCQSLQKTKNLLVHDLHPEQGAPAHTVISKVMQTLADTQNQDTFPYRVKVVAQPNHAVPTSWHLAQYSYAEADTIAQAALKMLQQENLWDQVQQKLVFPPAPDVPNQAFKGPF